MANELCLLGAGASGSSSPFLDPGVPIFAFVAANSMLNGSGTAATNGQTVATGTRFSGTLGDLAQGTDANRPTAVVSSSPNALDFNGSSSFMEVGSSLGAVRNVSGFSGVFIAKFDNLTGDDTLATATRNVSGSPRWVARVTATGAVLIFVRALDSDTGNFVASSAGAVTTGAYKILHYSFDYTACKGYAWVDGSIVINGATPTLVTAGNTSDTDSANLLTLGRDTGAARWVDGTIAGCAFYQSVFTAGQVASSYASLRSYFGI